jgi:uncharacterized membrane protein YgcG
MPQSLVLLENLLKFGAERCIDEAKERIYQIKSLIDFRYSDEVTMKDCGTGSMFPPNSDTISPMPPSYLFYGWRGMMASVREKSKQLYDFLNDNEAIRKARNEAKKHVDKYQGFSNDTISSYSGGGGGYGGGGYGGSGGGSYGGGMCSVSQYASIDSLLVQSCQLESAPS